MKLFIDTADIDEIREANSWGILSGVTTNPSLAAKAGRDFRSSVKEICSIVHGPVSAEAVSVDTVGMVAEGRELAAIAPNIVVKIPATLAGLAATKTLADEGISVNTTLVFSVNQALLAAAAGTAFVSPFVGRLDDIGQDGMALLVDLVQVFATYGYKTEIIAASIRHTEHVHQSALIGVDIATIPFSVLKNMISHPLTDKGITRFLEDWRKLQEMANVE